MEIYRSAVRAAQQSLLVLTPSCSPVVCSRMKSSAALRSHVCKLAGLCNPGWNRYGNLESGAKSSGGSSRISWACGGERAASDTRAAEQRAPMGGGD